MNRTEKIKRIQTFLNGMCWFYMCNFCPYSINDKQSPELKCKLIHQNSPTAKEMLMSLISEEVAHE